VRAQGRDNKVPTELVLSRSSASGENLRFITNRNYLARAVKLGDPVNVGDILRAKSKSRAEVTFLDGNILRLAENTRVRITDYQPGEGKTTTLDLFRGKTQNIVSGLARNARYELHTPTAVVGVRGTDFIAFFQSGVSGFIPKEGTIYGYNRNMPKDIKTVSPGQAIMVFAPDKPPVVQPAGSAGAVTVSKVSAVPSGKETTSSQAVSSPKLSDTSFI